jgi:hypothetical protein
MSFNDPFLCDVLKSHKHIRDNSLISLESAYYTHIILNYFDVSVEILDSGLQNRIDHDWQNIVHSINFFFALMVLIATYLYIAIVLLDTF